MSFKGREHWGTHLGFILATAGAAVGLGNLWRFPTAVGRNGGGVFVVVYLIIVLLIGIPGMMAELTLGRRAQKSPVGAFRALAPGSGWWIAGALGVLAGFVILSFYAVIAGWSLAYMLNSFAGRLQGLDSAGLDRAFTALVSDPVRSVFWMAVFMTITVTIVSFGITRGIERWNRVMVPGVVIILVVLLVRSLTLEGAMAGLAWFLRPDFSRFTFRTVLEALGQVFFSIGIGMGVMLTYGSYLTRRENIPQSTVAIAFADLSIAMLAGIAIIPAVFALDLTPAAGPGLLFVTVPGVFNRIPAGSFFGGIFFLMVAFAALTSAVSLLEVVVAYLMDERDWPRSLAALAMGAAIALLGVPSALSQGVLAPFRIAGREFLSLMDFLASNILLPVGGLLTTYFVAWVWGTYQFREELRQGAPALTLAGLWTAAVKYVVPLSIAAVLATGLLGLR